jgi:AraC-like DNA-binding protein
MPEIHIPENEVIIRYYRSDFNTVKNKIILNRNMVNLVISGTKSIVYPGISTTVSADELVILSNGNILTSEVVPDTKAFASVLIYFSNEVLLHFLVKYANLLKDTGKMGAKNSFLTYEQDAFIKQYVTSLQLLLELPSKPTPEIRHLKLEELLLYLLHQDAIKLQSLKFVSKDREDLLLRKAVETHIGQPVTVEELAFLCNMSSSTFKRKFRTIYGTSPQKWLLFQKLQLAADLLKNPMEKSSLVYFKVGYENHSSFTHAFRQQYGISPSAFQASQLNVQL